MATVKISDKKLLDDLRAFHSANGRMPFVHEFPPVEGGSPAITYIKRYGKLSTARKLAEDGVDELAFYIPQRSRPAKFLSIRDKFFLNIHVEGDCWIWHGTRSNSGGYPQLRDNKIAFSVHRYAYETWIAPLTSSQFVKHRCGNTLCVNPDHLEIRNQDVKNLS